MSTTINILDGVVSTEDLPERGLYRGESYLDDYLNCGSVPCWPKV